MYLGPLQNYTLKSISFKDIRMMRYETRCYSKQDANCLLWIFILIWMFVWLYAYVYESNPSYLLCH